jgi:hypothetical protein
VRRGSTARGVPACLGLTDLSSTLESGGGAKERFLPIANIGRIMQRSMPEKRRTINRDDLIWSMGMVSFEDYVEPLKL